MKEKLLVSLIFGALIYNFAASYPILETNHRIYLVDFFPAEKEAVIGAGQDFEKSCMLMDGPLCDPLAALTKTPDSFKENVERRDREVVQALKFKKISMNEKHPDVGV